ncbi:hypothetical protein OF83DRAFT_1294847 [Amylostereum chailletii]|nr:hypothetical protein OF83DRAFT_1294847 [Amylostereum chailletii]
MTYLLGLSNYSSPFSCSDITTDIRRLVTSLLSSMPPLLRLRTSNSAGPAATTPKSPATLHWPKSISVEEKDQVHHMRHNFDRALKKKSELDLYKGIDRSLEYPVELYMEAYDCWMHWIPQGLVRCHEKVERIDPGLEDNAFTDEEDDTTPAKPTKLRTTKNSIAAGYYDSHTGSSPSLDLDVAATAPNVPTDSEEEILEIQSRRLTDFFLAISPLGEDALPILRGAIAVLEAKAAEDRTYATEEEECAAVRDSISQALPQIVQQAMYALDESPEQSLVWGIVVVGRCCQFFKFSRSILEELSIGSITEKISVEEARKHAVPFGDIHLIFDRVQDRYTSSFVKNIEEMMDWAKTTFL